MEYNKLLYLRQQISAITLGTWAFGGGPWWGKQNDADSVSVLDEVLKRGVTAIDTAPVYGRGRSESVIGAYIRKRRLREKVIIATKVGLRWDGAKIYHDLSRKRMIEELDESRKRLETDYFDLYQIHWPDPDTPIEESAEVMNEFYEKKIIGAIGVSNYSVQQMSIFMKYAPLHFLQPEYSMFNRSIEKDIVPFCLDNDISILSYAPLYSGLLTGKFFIDGVAIPNDTNRKMKQRHLQEPLFSINRKTLISLKDIASRYQRSLAQLAINWNVTQPGVASAIVGMRTVTQAKDNIGALGWSLSQEDRSEIDRILQERQAAIEGCR